MQRPITRPFEWEYWPKRRAKAIGELKEPEAAAALGTTILSRLGVLACVLGFCLHGLVSFASIVQLLASLP